MRRAILGLLVLLGVASACRPRGAPPVRLGAAEVLRYRARLASDLRRLTVSLELPRAARGRLLRLDPTAGWQRRAARLQDVRCGDRPLPRVAGGWLPPRGCARVTWSVRLASVPPSGYSVLSLTLAFDARRRWAFLPGAGWLLLPLAVSGGATLRLDVPAGMSVHHALERLPDGRLRLPDAPRSAQGMVGVGGFVTRTTAAAGLTVHHLLDRPPSARLERLLRAHGDGLRYLVGVLGRPPVSRLNAFWFRRGAGARRIVGYTGRRAVALSYLARPRPAPHLTPALLPWLPLVTLLHEQVHQLGVAKPAWLGESLAQYYALKALGRLGVLSAADHARAFDRLTQPWSRTPEADSGTTLLAAQRRYRRTGSVAWYRIFYTNGARFWRAVDRAIGQRSRGRESLDDLVRGLRRLRFDATGHPPRAFGELLVRHGGAAVRRLLARWVGLRAG